MKKQFSFAFTLILLCALSGYFFDWWMMAIVSAVVAFWFSVSRMSAFAIGFISIFFLWFGLSYYLTTHSTSKIIDMVGAIFQNTSTFQLCLISGCIGGITAGLGSWTGSSIRLFLKN